MKPSARSTIGTRTTSGVGVGDLIVPRFPATSLSTKAFKWLHTEAWNDELNISFAEIRQAPPVGLFAGVPYESGRRRSPPLLLGRWLLLDAEGKKLGALEVHAYWRGFRSLHAIVTECRAPGGWQGEWLDALSFMLSGLFILTEADLLRILPIGAAAEQVAAGDFGAAKTVWTPFRDMAQLADLAGLGAAEGGLRMTTIECDPASWWQRPAAVRDRAALSYLGKRRDLAERLENLQYRRRPRAGGVLSRFFSLFSRRS